MKTDFSAVGFGDIGSEQTESNPYSTTVGDGPSWPLGTPAQRFPQGASPAAAGLCGELGAPNLMVPESGFRTIAPSAPDLSPTRTPAPGDPLIVKALFWLKGKLQ
jgi:hypothetical protein